MRVQTALSIGLILSPVALARPWTPSDGCPTTIKTVISSDPCYTLDSYGCKKGPQFTGMDVLHTALLSCPNITDLDLRVTGLGCSEWPNRWNFPFHPAGGDKYPPLKSLRLEGYHFGIPGQSAESGWDREAWVFPKPYYWTTKFSDDLFWWFPDGSWCGQVATWVWKGHWRTWMQWRQQPLEQKEKSNFGLWLDAMDWSNIEDLTIIGRREITDEMIEKLPSRLASLTKLETTNAYFINALEKNTLTHLKWIGTSRNCTLPSILEHQGSSLQDLEFRCEELSCRNFGRASDITVLSNMTRNLTHLTINVPRNGTWPFESLQAIASLPHLERADLYMNIQSDCVKQRPSITYNTYEAWEQKHGADYCRGEDQFQRPFVDQVGANELFAYMKESNPSGRLTNVTFWVGDWSRSWDGPLYQPPWAEGRSAKAVCGTEGKTNGDEWCVVEGGHRYWRMRHSYYDGWGDDELDDGLGEEWADEDLDYPSAVAETAAMDEK